MGGSRIRRLQQVLYAIVERIASNPRLGGGLLLAGLLVAWLPYLLLTRFAHPIADDYNLTVNAMRNGVWGGSRDLYFDWSGRFSSNPFILANPLLWGGLNAYRMLPLAWLALTAAAFYWFVSVWFRGALSPLAKVNLSLSLGLVYLFQAPSLVESLYWFTGAVTYHGAHLLLLAYLALLVAYFQAGSARGRRGYLVVLAPLAFLITGFNETIMLGMLVLHGYAAYRCWTLRRRVHAAWVLLSLAAMVGTAVSILAPGNVVRGSFFPDRHDVVLSVIYSSFQLVRFSAEWVSTAALLVGSLALVPVVRLLLQVSKLAREALVLPPLEAALMLPLSIIIGVFPPYWVTGILGQHRTLNTAYFLFLLAWLVNLITWVHIAERRKWRITLAGPVRVVAAAVAVVVMAVTSNGYGAAADLLDGTAARFDQEMESRYDVIEAAQAAGETEVVLDPIEARPATLFLLDLRADPDDLVNRGQSDYFGINVSVPDRPPAA